MDGVLQKVDGPADHGGAIDAARARFGGARADWIDLSTGINPEAYPVPDFPAEAWAALPDRGAETALLAAARSFWHVPDGADIVAGPGTSALIARLPSLRPAARIHIPGPTYNEHRRAFASCGWQVTDTAAQTARVLVQPNNPDGRIWTHADADAAFVILDESFADAAPETTLIAHAARPGTVVLKGLGKFWGLAGLRLGFAIGDPALIARLRDLIGPWPVSGPALALGTIALADAAWAETMRARLVRDAARLDARLAAAGATIVGGTPLFRLAAVPDAAQWQDHLARARIWTRVFPYSRTWLRFGLPGNAAQWSRLDAALAGLA